MKTTIHDDYFCRTPDSETPKGKILLVYPKVGADARNVSLYPPLSVLYLAAVLEKNPVAIFDQRVDPIEKYERLLAQNPLCVGFSIMTGVQIRYALELAQMAKERGIPTVFGGVHATILPEQTQADSRVDYVVAGEGELGFQKLVQALQTGTRPAPVQEGDPVDLDRLAPLPYDLVDVENYVHSAIIEGRALPVLFSRGCPFGCTFCCNPVTTKRRWRAQSVDRAMAQIDSLVEKYQLDSIIFWDENLSANPRLLNELAGRIGGRVKWFAQVRTNSLLKYDLSFLERSGARCFSCGIESGSPRILDAIKKEETVEEYLEANRRLAKTNISVWYNYLTGFPEETLDDLKLTIQIALQILDENPNANNNTFYFLTPYPGTQIAEQHLKTAMPGRLEEWADFGRHNFKAAWHSPEMLQLYSRIYFSSKFVGRKFLRMFPGQEDLKGLVDVLTDKWRAFDFYNDEEWEQLQQSGWKVLKTLFGENAY